MKERKTQVICTPSLPEYFKNMIDKTMSRQNLELQEETACYVVNLLHDFTRTEEVYPKGSDALALVFLEALQNQDHQQRVDSLRRVGDVALYISGFFSDSLNRSLYDVDYYIGIGGKAYGNLTSLVRDNTFHGIFAEMSEKFYALVDMLSEISEEKLLTRNEDILRVYERWLKTGSKHLYEKLVEQGVLPVEDASNTPKQ